MVRPPMSLNFILSPPHFQSSAPSLKIIKPCNRSVARGELFGLHNVSRHFFAYEVMGESPNSPFNCRYPLNAVIIQLIPLHSVQFSSIQFILKSHYMQKSFDISGGNSGFNLGEPRPTIFRQDNILDHVLF